MILNSAIVAPAFGIEVVLAWYNLTASGFLSMIRFIKNLVQYRELLLELITSNIKARYKQTALGIGWAILQPLIFTAIIFFVFSKFLKIPSENVPYPIFVLAALLSWILLSTSISFAIPILLQNVNLLRRVYFPREIFVVAAIVPSLIDFFIALIIFLGMLIYYGIPFTFHIILLPILLFIQILLILGISLGGAILNVAFRDIAKSLPLILQIWMFASPVVYPLSLIPENWKKIYMLNPMVGVIEGYRKIFLEQSFPDFYSLFLSFVITLTIFFLGYYAFKKGEEVIADII